MRDYLDWQDGQSHLDRLGHERCQDRILIFGETDFYPHIYLTCTLCTNSPWVRHKANKTPDTTQRCEGILGVTSKVTQTFVIVSWFMFFPTKERCQ